MNFKSTHSPGGWWYGIITSSMEKNDTGQERNGIFDARILNFEFGRKFLQRLFTFHYATVIITLQEFEDDLTYHSRKETKVFGTYLKKMERYKPLLWKWSTKSNKLYLHTCWMG